MDNDFTTAANKSAWEKYQGDWDAAEQVPVDDWGYTDVQRRAHVEGWVAARDHLAAQEPTDAEVLAALNSDYALRYGGRGGPAESLELYGDEHVQIMRAALVAARNARMGN